MDPKEAFEMAYHLMGMVFFLVATVVILNIEKVVQLCAILSRQ